MIKRVIDTNGNEWEVKILGDGPEVEVRKLPDGNWEDAIWSIFCENHGIDHDALA